VEITLTQVVPKHLMVVAVAEEVEVEEVEAEDEAIEERMVEVAVVVAAEEAEESLQKRQMQRITIT
jgi:hypothetical protein